MGLLAAMYLRVCYLTSTVTLTEPSRRAIAMMEASARPAVFVVWHHDFVVGLVALQSPIVPKGVVATNDSLGGYAVQMICRVLRLSYVAMPMRQSLHHKFQGTRNVLERQGGLYLTADFGRPWLVARPTARLLANSVSGVVIPTCIEHRWRLGFRFPSGWGLHLPLPFSRYAVWCAAPWRVDTAPRGRDDRLAEALDGLRLQSAFARQRPHRPNRPHG